MRSTCDWRSYLGQYPPSRYSTTAPTHLRLAQCFQQLCLLLLLLLLVAALLALLPPPVSLSLCLLAAAAATAVIS